MNVPVRRALVSVSDKTGLVELARALAHRNVEIISTGGTARALREAGGISAAVVVVSSISPRPVDDVVALTSRFPMAVTVEAHVLSGGVGSLVAEIIADNGVSCRLLRLGVETPYGNRSGSEEYLHELHGLTPSAVADRVSAALGSVIRT